MVLIRLFIPKQPNGVGEAVHGCASTKLLQLHGDLIAGCEVAAEKSYFLGQYNHQNAKAVNVWLFDHNPTVPCQHPPKLLQAAILIGRMVESIDERDNLKRLVVKRELLDFAPN